MHESHFPTRFDQQIYLDSTPAALAVAELLSTISAIDTFRKAYDEFLRIHPENVELRTTIFNYIWEQITTELYLAQVAGEYPDIRISALNEDAPQDVRQHFENQKKIMVYRIPTTVQNLIRTALYSFFPNVDCTLVFSQEEPTVTLMFGDPTDYQDLGE